MYILQISLLSDFSLLKVVASHFLLYATIKIILRCTERSVDHIAMQYFYVDNFIAGSDKIIYL